MMQMTSCLRDNSLFSKIYPTIPEERCGWWSDYGLDIWLEDLDISGYSLVDLWGGQYLPWGFEVVLLWGMRWWNKWLWIATDLGGAPTYVILHPLISCYTHSGPVTPLIGTIHTTMLRRKHGTVCWSNAAARLDAINLTLTTNPQPPTTATNSSRI